MQSRELGNAAVHYVAACLMDQDFEVCIPIADVYPHDLVFRTGYDSSTWYTVQVKHSYQRGRHKTVSLHTFKPENVDFLVIVEDLVTNPVVWMLPSDRAPASRISTRKLRGIDGWVLNDFLERWLGLRAAVDGNLSP